MKETDIESRELLKSIPFSNDTISNRIDEMDDNIVLQTKEFSMQLDECPIRNNESILMCYVRHNEDYGEYMLFCTSIINNKGEPVYNIVKYYFELKEIHFKNCIALATDGAPAMIDMY